LISVASTPVQKLRAGMDTPAEEFCVVISEEEIDEFKTYVKEITLDPQIACIKVKKLLLLYVATIQFIIMSFDTNKYLDSDLVDACDTLAKTLYIFYKDINTILYARQIESIWKTYVKLCKTAGKVPTSSTYKVEASRERLLNELRLVSKRIMGI
jgi:hypothetical protein